MDKIEADLIIHNARIQTVDQSFSVAEAIAVSGDSILEVGPEHEILNQYTSKEIIDLGGKFIYPGIIDAHCHFLGYARFLDHLNLGGCASEEEMYSHVLQKSKENKDGWIIGRGWDQNLWGGKQFPENRWLDKNLPGRLIVLKRVDGHALLVSTAVLEAAGIDKDTRIEGGLVEVVNGRCTGILLDKATDLVEAILPRAMGDELKKLVLEAQENCLSKGITMVSDAGLDLDEIHLIEKWQREGVLKIKVYAMLNPTKENFDHYLKKGPARGRDLIVNSFKFYADGALGSRGAALLEDYSDDPGRRGLILTPADSLRKYAEKLKEAGFQVNTHAIGDSANRMVLGIYGNVLGGTNDRRWRIEHAQVVHEEDRVLFGKFNVIPSVQPVHAASDMPWAGERLGEERLPRAYAYKNLMSENGMLAVGTDFPVEDIDPLNNILAAVKRINRKGDPTGGFMPDQALDFEDCLRGMTIWAAIANFCEAGTGSLEAGKRADFIILNRDLSELDEGNIDKYVVETAYINGKSVYIRNGK